MLLFTRSRSTLRARLAWLPLVLLVLIAGTAAAEPSPSRFVIETYVGKRPAEAKALMAAVRPAMERHGFTAQPAAVTKLLAMPTVGPGLADPKVTGQIISQKSTEAIRAFADARYDDAAAQLEAVRMLAIRNPIVVAREPKTRDSVATALVYLALAHGRQSMDPTLKNDAKKRAYQKARDEAMAELIRVFPGKVVSKTQYGAEAERVYRDAQQEVDKVGRGQLTVAVHDANAVTYVDFVVARPGRDTITAIAGAHYVVIDSPSGASGAYAPTIVADQETRLDVDWEVDAMLSTRDWVGLSFPSQKEAEREGEFVARLTRNTRTAKDVAVVSVRAQDHLLAVTGTVYELAPFRLLRSAQLSPLDPKAKDLDGKLDQLGAFIDRGTVGAALTVVDHTAPETPVADPSPAPRSRAPALVVPVHAEPPVAVTPQAPPPPAPSAPVATEDESVLELIPVVICGGGVGAVGIGVYTLLLTNVPGDRPYQRSGLGLIAGGSIGIAASLFYWHHKANTTSAPVVSLAPGGATIGWSAHF